MYAVIKKSVYRNGGNVRWDMTIHDLIVMFKQAKPASQRIGITSAEKGFGKSTALEYLTRFSTGLCVDGDIMSTLALLVISKRPFSNDLMLNDLARGQGVKGFLPWDTVVDGDKSEAFTAALSSILGKDFAQKISLCTTFYGASLTAKIIIVPDYGTYKMFMRVRTEAMRLDSSSSQEMRDHVAEYHTVLSWPEFYRVQHDHLIKQKKTTMPIFFCPNLGPDLYGLHLDYVWSTIDKYRPCPEGKRRKRIPFMTSGGPSI